MDKEAARKRYYGFIGARTQGVIATVGPDGKPEAALMDIATTPALEIIFETTNQTRKFVNLQANSRISFVIGWEDNETLQFDGVAELLSGRALEEALKEYTSVFPQKTSHRDWPGNHYFLARPDWVRFSSYRPPRKVEEFRFKAEEEAHLRMSWWRRLGRAPRPRMRN